MILNKSNLQETLFSLYLRLNGYFVTGFIVHAPEGNTTEMDALAIRFPFHKEPEREISTCPHISVSNGKIDFLICEVKGGNRGVNFNKAFRLNAYAVKCVLRRFGAFSDSDIEKLIPQILEKIKPEVINKSKNIPVVDIEENKSQIRCVLVSLSNERKNANNKPYIFSDDIMEYLWACFHPEVSRLTCDVKYHCSLWGVQYQRIVEYFKDEARGSAGSIDDLCKYLDISDA